MKTAIAVTLLLALSACAALKTNGAKVCEQLDLTHASVDQAFTSATATCIANGLPTSKEAE